MGKAKGDEHHRLWWKPATLGGDCGVCTAPEWGDLLPLDNI